MKTQARKFKIPKFKFSKPTTLIPSWSINHKSYLNTLKTAALSSQAKVLPHKRALTGS